MRKKLFISTFILISVFSVSYGQTNEEIIVDKTYYGKTLKQIFWDLGSSYKLDMDFNIEDVKTDIIPGRRYKNKTLQFVLDDLCTEFDLNFKIVNRQVVIRKKGEEIILKEQVYERKTNYTLSGIVKDKQNGEALPFAQIIVKGTQNGTTTNVDGYFTLFKVPSDTSVIEIAYIGYNKKQVFLTPKLVSNHLVIELIPSITHIEGVTVTAEREDIIRVADDISTISLSPKEIGSLPTLGDKDIFRTFQLLPGVSGSNESSAGLYVRGGTPDQNLILYDGFTVYHQEHLFGMYSAFNTNAIKDVKLLKGGFEAKYGGRLSSAVDIIGKTGNENEFNIGGDISLLSFNAYTEIPLGGNGSIFLAARKSYQGFLYEKFFAAFNEDNNSQVPQAPAGGMRSNKGMESADPTSYFYDLNGKITYKITERDILALSFFNGQDDLDNSREINRSRGGANVSGGLTDLTKWGNWGSSFKWSRKWSDKFYLSNLISYSNYYSVRDRGMSRTITQDDVVTTINKGTSEDNNLRDFSYKMGNEFKTGGNNQIEFGVQMTHYDIMYDYTQNDTVSILNMDDAGNQFAFYLQDKWNPFGKISLLPGLRTTYYDVTHKVYMEPRFQITYDLSNSISLKAAWGKYFQFANRVIREDIMTGGRDFWVLSDGEEIPVGEAIHYIGGISYESNDYLFDVEAYYKELSGLSEYTLRFAPTFGSIDYNSFFYQGKGYAQGIEFLVQKKFGDFTGWVGYTLGEVLYNFPVYGDGYFPAAHDVTHEFKLVNSYTWKKWTFSGTWIYATGKPYTEPLGGYTLTMLDGSTADFITTGQKNGSRYPDYHRLDIAAKYNVVLGKASNVDFGFSLFNVYNRKNVWYKEFEVDETGLTETNVYLLGITPNLSVSFKLK